MSRLTSLVSVLALVLGAMILSGPAAHAVDYDCGDFNTQAQAQKYLLEQEKDAIEGVLTVNGFNFAGPGQNSGLIFIKLRDWDERKKSTLAVSAVLGRANKYFGSIKDAQVIAIPPPAVLELGNTAGFDLMLQNRGGLSREQFLAARNQLLGAAAQDKRIADLEKTISGLIEKAQQQEFAKIDNKLDMDRCFVQADDAYWRIIELNGRKKPGTENRPGGPVWTAANDIWEMAATKKRLHLEECRTRFAKN